jgi:hypothetical protein
MSDDARQGSWKELDGKETEMSPRFNRLGGKSEGKE